ncbi:MAG: hypothetical protein AABX88_02930 [Nanoarchaeota archaeon]
MKIDKHVKRALGYLVLTLFFSAIVLFGDFSFLDKGITGNVMSSPQDLEVPKIPEIISNCYRTDDSNIYTKGKICFSDENGKDFCIAEDYCGEGFGSLSQIECISDSAYETKWRGCINGCKDGVCVCNEGDCPESYICKKGVCVSNN